MPAEFAPAEFATGTCRCRWTGAGRSAAQRGRVPDLPRTDLAEAQMRRQARGRVDVRPVAVGRIADHAVGEERLQPLLRRAFARGPRLAQAAGPIRLGRFERPVLDGLARDAAAEAAMSARATVWAARRRQHPPPERREDPQAPAILAADLGRLDQEIAGEFFRIDADAGKRGFDLGGNRELGHLRDLVPEHRPGAGLARNLRDCRCRRPRRSTSVVPIDSRRLLQFAQRLRQPPARGGAERTRTHAVCVRAILVEHVEAYHRRAAPARRMQGRVIGEAEIVTEPDDDGFHGAGIHSLEWKTEKIYGAGRFVNAIVNTSGQIWGRYSTCCEIRLHDLDQASRR